MDSLWSYGEFYPNWNSIICLGLRIILILIPVYYYLLPLLHCLISPDILQTSLQPLAMVPWRGSTSKLPNSPSRRRNQIYARRNHRLCRNFRFQQPTTPQPAIYDQRTSSSCQRIPRSSQLTSILSCRHHHPNDHESFDSTHAWTASK